MSSQGCTDLSLIQDEDALRKMWQQTEDFGQKKEIRMRMYRLREERLRSYYISPGTETVTKKNHSHVESIPDQGFMTMKTKEIRGSSTPTPDSWQQQDYGFSKSFQSPNQLIDLADQSGSHSVANKESHSYSTSSKLHTSSNQSDSYVVKPNDYQYSETYRESPIEGLPAGFDGKITEQKTVKAIKQSTVDGSKIEKNVSSNTIRGSYSNVNAASNVSSSDAVSRNAYSTISNIAKDYGGENVISDVGVDVSNGKAFAGHTDNTSNYSKVTSNVTGHTSNVAQMNTKVVYRTTTDVTRGSNVRDGSSSDVNKITSNVYRTSTDVTRGSNVADRHSSDGHKVTSNVYRTTTDVTRDANVTDRPSSEAHKVTSDVYRTTTDVTRDSNVADRHSSDAQKVTSNVYRTTTDVTKDSNLADRYSSVGQKVTSNVYRTTTDVTRDSNVMDRPSSDAHKVISNVYRTTTDVTRDSNVTDRSSSDAHKITSNVYRTTTDVTRDSNVIDRHSSDGHKVTSNVYRTTTDVTRDSNIADRPSSDAQNVTSTVYRTTTDVTKDSNLADKYSSDGHKVTSNVYRTTTDVTRDANVADRHSSDSHKITSNVYRTTTDVTRDSNVADRPSSESHKITSNVYRTTTDVTRDSNVADRPSSGAHKITSDVYRTTTDVTRNADIRDRSSTDSNVRDVSHATDRYSTDVNNETTNVIDETSLDTINKNVNHKIMNELHKLDSYLSTQGNVGTAPTSPMSITESVYEPTDSKFTYQSTKISVDVSLTHNAFASTLRASPDREMSPAGRRSSSRSSLERPSPDRRIKNASSPRSSPDKPSRSLDRTPTFTTTDLSKKVTESFQNRTRKETTIKRKSKSPSPIKKKATPVSSPSVTRKIHLTVSSDDESDDSQATYKKNSNINLSSNKKTKRVEVKETKTSEATREFSDHRDYKKGSPSPVSIYRTKSPGYSSEGSVERELKHRYNFKKGESSMESSPERSAFRPIKTFKNTPDEGVRLLPSTKDLTITSERHRLTTTKEIPDYVEEDTTPLYDTQEPDSKSPICPKKSTIITNDTQKTIHESVKRTSTPQAKEISPFPRGTYDYSPVSSRPSSKSPTPTKYPSKSPTPSREIPKGKLSKTSTTKETVIISNQRPQERTPSKSPEKERKKESPSKSPKRSHHYSPSITTSTKSTRVTNKDSTNRDTKTSSPGKTEPIKRTSTKPTDYSYTSSTVSSTERTKSTSPTTKKIERPSKQTAPSPKHTSSKSPTPTKEEKSKTCHLDKTTSKSKFTPHSPSPDKRSPSKSPSPQTKSKPYVRKAVTEYPFKSDTTRSYTHTDSTRTPSKSPSPSSKGKQSPREKTETKHYSTVKTSKSPTPSTKTAPTKSTSTFSPKDTHPKTSRSSTSKSPTPSRDISSRRKTYPTTTERHPDTKSSAHSPKYPSKSSSPIKKESSLETSTSFTTSTKKQTAERLLDRSYFSPTKSSAAHVTTRVDNSSEHSLCYDDKYDTQSSHKRRSEFEGLETKRNRDKVIQETSVDNDESETSDDSTENEESHITKEERKDTKNTTKGYTTNIENDEEIRKSTIDRQKKIDVESSNIDNRAVRKTVVEENEILRRGSVGDGKKITEKTRDERYKEDSTSSHDTYERIDVHEGREHGIISTRDEVNEPFIERERVVKEGEITGSIPKIEDVLGPSLPDGTEVNESFIIEERIDTEARKTSKPSTKSTEKIERKTPQHVKQPHETIRGKDDEVNETFIKKELVVKEGEITGSVPKIEDVLGESLPDGTEVNESFIIQERDDTEVRKTVTPKAIKKTPEKFERKTSQPVKQQIQKTVEKEKTGGKTYKATEDFTVQEKKNKEIRKTSTPKQSVKTPERKTPLIAKEQPRKTVKTTIVVNVPNYKPGKETSTPMKSTVIKKSPRTPVEINYQKPKAKENSIQRKPTKTSTTINTGVRKPLTDTSNRASREEIEIVSTKRDVKKTVGTAENRRSVIKRDIQLQTKPKESRLTPITSSSSTETKKTVISKASVQKKTSTPKSPDVIKELPVPSNFDKPEPTTSQESSSSSEDEEPTKLHQQEIKQKYITSVTNNTDANLLNVVVHLPSSSRETTPDKRQINDRIYAISGSEDGSTTRLADHIAEPEDVEIFDSSNLDVTHLPRNEKSVSVADRVSKYMIETKPVMSTVPEEEITETKNNATVSKGKHLFESIAKNQTEENQVESRRTTQDYQSHYKYCTRDDKEVAKDVKTEVEYNEENEEVEGTQVDHLEENEINENIVLNGTTNSLKQTIKKFEEIPKLSETKNTSKTIKSQVTKSEVHPVRKDKSPSPAKESPKSPQNSFEVKKSPLPEEQIPERAPQKVATAITDRQTKYTLESDKKSPVPKEQIPERAPQKVATAITDRQTKYTLESDKKSPVPKEQIPERAPQKVATAITDRQTKYTLESDKKSPVPKEQIPERAPQKVATAITDRQTKYTLETDKKSSAPTTEKPYSSYPKEQIPERAPQKVATAITDTVKQEDKKSSVSVTERLYKSPPKEKTPDRSPQKVASSTTGSPKYTPEEVKKSPQSVTERLYRGSSKEKTPERTPQKSANSFKDSSKESQYTNEVHKKSSVVNTEKTSRKESTPERLPKKSPSPAREDVNKRLNAVRSYKKSTESTSEKLSSTKSSTYPRETKKSPSPGKSTTYETTSNLRETIDSKPFDSKPLEKRLSRSGSNYTNKKEFFESKAKTQENISRKVERKSSDLSNKVQVKKESSPDVTKKPKTVGSPFGVTLRERPTTTESIKTITKEKVSSVNETDKKIEEIFDLEILEIMLEEAVEYDIRSRIRAQIRLVKRQQAELKRSTPEKSPARELKKTSSTTKGKTSRDDAHKSSIVTKVTTTTTTLSSSKMKKDETDHEQDYRDKVKRQLTYEVKPQHENIKSTFGNVSSHQSHRNIDQSYKSQVDHQYDGEKVIEDMATTTDSITSGYGLGPTDDFGRPLFGLKALRTINTESSNETASYETETYESVSSRRKAFSGLNALRSTQDGGVSHAYKQLDTFRDTEINDDGEKIVDDSINLNSIIKSPQGKRVMESRSKSTAVSSRTFISTDSDGNISLVRDVIRGDTSQKNDEEPVTNVTEEHFSYETPKETPRKASGPTITDISYEDSSTGSRRSSGSKLHSSSLIKKLSSETFEKAQKKFDERINKNLEENRNFERESKKESKISTRNESTESYENSRSYTTQNLSKETSGKTSQYEVEPKKVTRGNSVKDLKNRFQQPTVSSNLRQNSSTSREIVDRSSPKKDLYSVSKKEEKEQKSFIGNQEKITDVKDVISRMKSSNLGSKSDYTDEETEALSLLNKFIGASVILHGLEQGSASNSYSTTTSSNTKFVKQFDNSKSKARLESCENIENIWDEQELRTLLEACDDYESRQKIRLRLRAVMSEHKACSDLVQSMEEKSNSETNKEISESTSTTKTSSFTEVRSSKSSVVSSSSGRLTKANSVSSPFAKFQQMDRQNSLPNYGSGKILFKYTDPKLARSASSIKDRLLSWVKAHTKEYENIKIENFSTSWNNGLAFCALIHHFYPNAFDYNKLTGKNRRYNFQLAFTVAEEKADIMPLLDVDDMVKMERPDWKCVFTYVQSIYRRLQHLSIEPQSTD